MLLTCIQRIKTVNNQIVSYKMQDEQGNIYNYDVYDVRRVLRSVDGTHTITNLYFTKDGKVRLKENKDIPFYYLEASELYKVFIKDEDFRYIDYKTLIFKSCVNLKTYLARVKLMANANMKYKFINKHLLIVSTDKTILMVSDKQIKFRDSDLREQNCCIIIGHFEGHAFAGIDFTEVDTAEMTDMSNMFKNSRIQRFNFTNFNTSNVTCMRRMFASSSMYNADLDLSMFDTRQVRTMECMFHFCHLYKPLILPFNTEKVVNMDNMFSYCDSPKIDIHTFSYKNVKRQHNMFEHTRAEIIQ